MVIIEGQKYACDRCIRGHRVSHCNHVDQALTRIKPKGRPVTHCNHCRESRKSKHTHVKCLCGKVSNAGGCQCGVTGVCLCSSKAKVPRMSFVGLSEEEEWSHLPEFIPAGKYFQVLESLGETPESQPMVWQSNTAKTEDSASPVGTFSRTSRGPLVFESALASRHEGQTLDTYYGSAGIQELSNPTSNPPQLSRENSFICHRRKGSTASVGSPASQQSIIIASGYPDALADNYQEYTEPQVGYVPPLARLQETQDEEFWRVLCNDPNAYEEFLEDKTGRKPAGLPKTAASTAVRRDELLKAVGASRNEISRGSKINYLY